MRGTFWGTILIAAALSACQAAAPTATERAAEATPARLPSQPASPRPADPGATPLPEPTPEPPPRPSPTPCVEAAGQLIESSYPGVAVSSPVRYLIYLPPCYVDSGPDYPALYFLHGLPYDEQHWLDLGVVERYEAGLQRGEWTPMLLVMPDQPEPLFTSTDGGPGSYEQEFLQGLLAHVESRYAADGSRRGLAGISRGGIWALEIAFRNPQDFVAMAALSPALAVNSARQAYDPMQLARANDQFPTEMLLLAGDLDWATVMTSRLSQILIERNIAHHYLLVSGDHSDPTWENALPQVLTFLTGAVSRP